MKGPVEDVGQTDLELPDRQPVAVSRGAVLWRERMRETGQPAAEEFLDILGRELVAHALEPGGVGTGQESVVQRLEGDATVAELTLRPLVSVEAHTDGERGVGREFDEAGTEVAIEDVEVVVVDEDLSAVEVEAHPAVPTAAFDRAEGSVSFLGDADEDHALLGAKPSQTCLGDIVLSLAGLEVDDRDPVSLGEGVNGVHEALGHLPEQGRRGNRVLAVSGQEVDELARPLQSREVAVEVDPVDGLHLERDVIAQYGVDVRHDRPREFACAGPRAGRVATRAGSTLVGCGARRLAQAAQHLDDADQKRTGRDVTAEVDQSAKAKDIEKRCALRGGTAGEHVEAALVGAGDAACTFGDVQYDREAGTFELVTQHPVAAPRHERRQHRVELQGELINVEPFVVELRLRGTMRGEDSGLDSVHLGTSLVAPVCAGLSCRAGVRRKPAPRCHGRERLRDRAPSRGPCPDAGDVTRKAWRGACLPTRRFEAAPR